MSLNILETNLCFKDTLQKRYKTDYIVLHHTAVSNATPEEVHNWHLKRGWKGFGYHYYICKDGSIYRGRPEDTIGAHVDGYNNMSIGICAEGDFTKDNMPNVQKQALIALVKDLKKRYPNAKIVGHKELAATVCPGDNFPLEEIKNKEDDDMYLKQGMNGVEVKKLQENLISLGYGRYLEPYGADGKFGEKTRTAVEAFQRDNGLKVDGVAGPMTLNKIEELLKTPNIKQLLDKINQLQAELQEAKVQMTILESQKNKYEKAIQEIKQILSKS